MQNLIGLNLTKQTLCLGGILILLADFALAATEFTPGSQPVGWVSKPEVSYFNVASGTEVFYQIDFRKNTWAGNVLAKDIGSTARLLTTGPWDDVDPTITTAASILENANWDTGRKIATFSGAFRWASLTAQEKQSLENDEKILKYIRGDRSNEEPDGLSLYPRESILGDIIHSNISYVDDGTNQTLYAGSNDGMLHSFNANTGVENWAYIPSMVIPNLSQLAEKPRVHSYSVDGPISIASFADSGKTILVSALGAGGAGLFAMDITTPTASNEADVRNKVLWEISASGDYKSLGYTYGTPVLTRLNSGEAAVIIGNGYVNKHTGTAVLYVINAVSGALISAIDTNSGSPASPNGLSSPTLYSSDEDATPEYAYAGDIDGNLWKFDLDNNSASKIYTAADGQAITTAPVVHPHPVSGQMVVFATGRILTSGDQNDASDHHVYGVWDGAPNSNNSFVEQTLSPSFYDGDPVRSVSNNELDWSAGNDKGWFVRLPPGERVVGEKPFYNNGRVYLVSTNPTTDPTENWLHELVFNTGGSPYAPIFDLSHDGKFTDADLDVDGNIPVAKYLGAGAFSQPLFVNGDSMSTTLYAYHQDLEVFDLTEPEDPGVSGGHFDFDIYYYDSETIHNPTGDGITKTVCVSDKTADKQLEDVSPDVCQAFFPAGYGYLADFTKSDQKCDGNVKYIDATCRQYNTVVTSVGDYEKAKHVHEYDDKYDVTGVDMQYPSLVDFRLDKAIPDPTTSFKVLVMNQYLNPAVLLSIGPDNEDYESIKTYAGLTDAPNADAAYAKLVAYTRESIGTLIYNLPLDAFKSKDWWGDGTRVRAGLIPTKTGCVNNVNADGSMKNTGTNGIFGLHGERFDGAFAIQIIRSDTPSSALEFNHDGKDDEGGNLTAKERAAYGWRVKQEHFTKYVLAEYTSFWHHPNGLCYGDADWVPDPPEDFDSNAKTEVKAADSRDPTDGIFGAGLAIVSVEVTNPSAGVVVTTTTYSDSSTYVKTETTNDDGTVTVTQKFRDGDEKVTVVYAGDGGKASAIDPNTGSPEEELSSLTEGRQTWRDIID